MRGRIPVSREVEIDKVLDLTDPAVRDRLGVRLAARDHVPGDRHVGTADLDLVLELAVGASFDSIAGM